MTIALSIILPAYNEALRLPAFLTEVRTYLEENHPDAYEVIVVDDGSHDDTAAMLAQIGRDWPALVVLSHPVNRGKGAAVRTGMLAARGDLLLFADADGATPITEAARLQTAIREGADVAIGSRLIQASGLVRKRTWLRRLAGRSFAALARWWLAIPERDTQCGFKMFQRDAGRRLFSAACEDRYLFDLELLALAHRLGLRVVEVPVSWHEVPGSHLSLTRELFRILLGLYRIRRSLRQLTDATRRCPSA
jgi:dolichyl-phosphate beta-glucosyltransferase